MREVLHELHPNPHFASKGHILDENGESRYCGAFADFDVQNNLEATAKIVEHVWKGACETSATFGLVLSLACAGVMFSMSVGVNLTAQSIRMVSSGVKGSVLTVGGIS